MIRKIIFGLAVLAVACVGAIAQQGNIIVPTVVATACTNQFIRSIAAATGAGTCASIAAADMPALTGDCTTSAGAVATTCKITSGVVTGSFDLTTATGATQDLTFSFTPSACQGFGSNSATSTAYTTFNSYSDSAGNQSALYINGSVGLYYVSTNKFFLAVDSTGSNYQLATISYATNKATLTWAKTGTPSGTFSYAVRCFK